MKRLLFVLSVLFASLCTSISALAADSLSDQQLAAIVGYYEGTLDFGDGDLVTAKLSITPEGYATVQLIMDGKTSTNTVSLKSGYDDFGVEEGYIYWYYEHPFDISIALDEQEVNSNTVKSCLINGITADKKSNEPQEIVDPDNSLTPEQLSAIVGYYEGTLDFGDGDLVTAKLSITPESKATVQLIMDGKTSTNTVSFKSGYDDFGVEEGYIYWYYEHPFDLIIAINEQDVNSNTVKSCLINGITAEKKSNEPKEIVDPDDGGDDDDTLMEPIKPDLNQYTHKMMVLGAPWGMKDLCMAILRDNDGRVVQKMTMRIDASELSAHMTDSVRTYEYKDNKMIEYLAVPHYDENDVLHMEPMNRTTTSYYRLADGHREVVEKAWFEDGEYVASYGREEYIFDSEGRKVNYKKYYGEELEEELTYTYDDKGGCLARGKYDGYSNYSGYTRYDANGNLRGNTEWGTYYEYFFDNKNHYQGYKYYDGYNFDDNTYRSVNDNNYFEIVETYDDGSAKKMKRKGDGQVRTFSREGNVETQKNSGNGTEVVITRTFDDQGRIIAKTSTENSFKSNFTYSNLKADKILGGVNTFSEDVRVNYNETVNWTTDYPLATAGYERTFMGFNEKATTTYNIVPLSVLPAQSTSEGIAISLGNDGDQVVLSSGGEIYLLDKGGKKRYSASFSGITVSSDGGKLVVTGWTPISPSASAKGARKASENIDLTNNDYDIYIPENTITINGKSLNEVYLPITLDDATTGIIEVKNDIEASAANARIYNLQGMQVKNPTHGQIIILNGKKVIVK